MTEMGTVMKVSPDREGWRLTIAARRTVRGLSRGGSVAVVGVCLTAVSLRRG
ncbi:MAG: riboflavin synthase, partial [Planctomycetota bacterium]